MKVDRNFLFVIFSCVLIFGFTSASIIQRYENLDYAYFGHDTHDYQSLAVNLLYGHDYKWGAFKPFNTYKFAVPPEDMVSGEAQSRYFSFMTKRYYNFFRTPGYPLFLCMTYKVFGIHPAVVKIIQSLMNGFSAAILPFLGYYYWKKLGYIAGLISAAIVIYRFLPFPMAITTESLILFSLAWWTLFFIYWDRNPSKGRTFSLGVYSAVIVLVKGLMALVSVFFVLYVFFKIKNLKKSIFLGLIYSFGFFLLIGPWCGYASMRSGHFVPLSTQFSLSILLSNNEDTLAEGVSYSLQVPSDNQKYTYGRLAKTGYSSFHKCLIFWREHLRDLPVFFWRKLCHGFGQYYAAWYVWATLAYYMWMAVKRLRFRGGDLEPIPFFPIIYLCNLVCILIFLVGDFRFALPFMPFFILPAVYFPLGVANDLFKKIRQKKLARSKLRVLA